MDAVTAGLIGAAIGVVGTLGGQAINPLATARHARKARNLELRREAYEAGLQLVHEITALDDKAPDSLAQADRLSRAMMVPLAQMRLIGDLHVAELYVELSKAIEEFLEAKARPASDLADRFGDAFNAFQFAARKDVGTEDSDKVTWPRHVWAWLRHTAWPWIRGSRSRKNVAQAASNQPVSGSQH